MKPNFSKEQLEYELTIKHFELRDGVLWRKEYVSKDGRVMKAKPVKSVISKGYIRIQVVGKWLLEHRIIFILKHNRPIKEGYQIHHDNNNPLDNRIENLKEVTARENCQNRQINIDGKLVGVSKHGGGWQAQIRVNGRLHCLGTYNTPEEAYRVYLIAVEEVNEHGHLVRSRTERNAAAGVVPSPRRARLRNTEQRGECEALEYDQLRTNSKRG